MHFVFFSSTNLFKFKSTPFEKSPSILYGLCLTRPISQSIASIPKKQQKFWDRGFERYMLVEKMVRQVLKFQKHIFKKPHNTLPVSSLDNYAQRLGFRPQEIFEFVLKFPQVFVIYEHPVSRTLFCGLTRRARHQILQENRAIRAQIPEAATRLRKLLMMSNTGQLPLLSVKMCRKQFGLPYDFRDSIVLKYPQFFRLLVDDGKQRRREFIESVERDPNLAVCAIERERERECREKGIDAEDIRFSFVVNFPHAFNFRNYKLAVWKWQKFPYWSPYEDVSRFDLRSVEVQKRMVKRAVAMFHELLWLTVEKKIVLERISYLRKYMNFPRRLKDLLLQHQGIFYVSSRWNKRRMHTVFLREAYRNGKLIKPNDVYSARRMLAELVKLSLNEAKPDAELINDVGGTRHHRELESISGDDFNYGGAKGYMKQHSKGDLECHVTSDDSDVDDIVTTRETEGDLDCHFSSDDSDVDDSSTWESEGDLECHVNSDNSDVDDIGTTKETEDTVNAYLTE